MKQTPLNSVHRELGARMVDFGGWDMPVQYSGVIDEHLAVRNAAGLFDVSHMGEVEVKGEGALTYIQYLTINDASVMTDGQVQYSAICYLDGGVVDDVTLYRFDSDHYLFCVNASNTDKDFAWMQKVLTEGDFPDVTIENISDDCAQLALQGPEAEKILAALTDIDLTSMAYYRFAEGYVAGESAIVSRTGYTGEDGFEIYFSPTVATHVWQSIVEAGAPHGLLPIGLGARDTLRLEKKYALYGHELSDSINPLEAGLNWITKLDKGDFVGRDAIVKMKESGVPRKLVAIKMTGAGIPRADYPVYAASADGDGEGVEIGVVTSGTMSPTLKVGIALALVATEYSTVGTELTIGIRKNRVGAVIVKPPFV